MFFLDTNTILQGALIFFRIGALLFAMPFFGETFIAPSVKILTALSLAIGLYPVVPVDWASLANLGAFSIALLVFNEIIVGLTIGYLSRLLFEGLVMAAGIVGYQMGFGTASLLLPGSDSQMNAFTALHRNLVMLIFLLLGFHHIFLSAIVETFTMIPAGVSLLKASLGETIIAATAQVFSVAVQLATPILISLLFSMASLGLLARTVPQLNVFTMSFPLNFFIGLTTYFLAIPFFPDWLKHHYSRSAEVIFKAIRAFAL
ncbi:MAG: flagellar biosynthetic protein FliR [Deltaproteobacteria bacterium]|nr:flagellar biosynthetic protein FliR [Deltaproteobacteria bacterium]